ncbi:hypothetical protein BpOF4_12700 [Alkalihalophilus pseudofirmus OF4]|uniref:Uncharacterized protein n=1 Tax=Alkalihalophilus pseudofirmus (strain ATCC BAA-2126 / JCM 17055 / OF4) TaxID=398511 RepID=D3FWU3_ALKPO|nr:hypothetical protein BpOF4_12700 [Alkalihalophilus pseudofirmus OF4]
MTSRDDSLLVFFAKKLTGDVHSSEFLMLIR